ncbi:Heterokaryon incompatibility protein (HET) domain containing protein [Naviculisporaceae sp. PSN 640]
MASVRVCSICKEATQQPTDEDWVFDHYSTYRELKQSDLAGCELCRLLRHVFLTQYSHRFGDSFAAADQYQLDLDQSEIDPSSGEPTAPFVLVNHFVDIDPDHSPYPAGSIGFSFYRAQDEEEAQDEDDQPLALDEVDGLIACETPAGSLFQTLGRVVGAPTSESPDISLAQKWMQSCKNHHAHHQCRPFTDVTLPTRVLDVRPSPGLDDVRLVITNGSQGRYITLSHCWGDPKKMPIQLTKDTSDMLQIGVPVSSLSRTFQDAVTVTRKLGYQYLWIDSLCILQGCSEDWQKAVFEMPEIYNHAELNICGPSAEDSTAGFLHRRHSPPESRSLDIAWRVSQNLGHQTLRLVYRGKLPNNGEPPHDEPNSKLATRGWILQERILSQRMLFFGSRNMYWECNTNSNYETMHCPLPNNSKLRMGVPKISFNDLTNSGLNCPDLGWRWTWYELVNTYSTMDLTYQTDKLPAISALAQRFSRVLGDQYIAGMWNSELFEGLSWYVNPMLPQKNQRPAVPTSYPADHYVAPSWSWASTTMAISHLNASARMWDYVPGETAEIVNIRVTPTSPDNPLSSVLPGSSLTLRARFIRAIVRIRPMEINGLGDHFQGRFRWKAYYYLENPKNSRDIELGTFFPDHELASSRSHELLFLPIAYASPRKRGSEVTERIPWGGVALAVEEIPGEHGKYRRRGLLFDESLCVYDIEDEAVLLRTVLKDTKGELALFEIV